MKSKMLSFLLASIACVACGQQDDANKATETTVTESKTRQVEQLTPADFRQTCEDSLAKARELFEKLERSPNASSVGSILKPVNDLFVKLDLGANKASLYAVVHPNEEIRTTAEECEQDFSKLATDISVSRPLYEALSQLDVSNEDDLTRRWTEKLLRDFRRAGVDKDEQTRARIVALQEELVELGQTFDRNIREDVRTLVLDSVDELDGLPDDYIEAHQPGDDRKIRLTTDYPNYIPFARYAHNDARRKEFAIMFRDRGYPANEAVLDDILTKRFELAQLLGYDNYADYITEDKMVKSADNAQAFIEKIVTAALPRSDQDYDVLLERLQKIDPDATSVGAWQSSYVSDIVRRENFELDSKALREYFAYDRVRDGIFDLVASLFEVTIRTWDTPVWHESVEAYELVENGEVIGRFFLDMHPRDGKFKHAAEFSIMTGVEGFHLPLSALVCNFPGGDGTEGLMEHGQVETFLHEFGHLIHDMFAGSQKWIGVSGISTEWDFVEAPSQMLEEWIWDKETLQRFAVNEEGQIIPDELVEKMNAARDFGRGIGALQQMFYASISLNYYNRDPATFELLPMLKELQERYSPYEFLEGTHMFANFGHLFGYSAIYYTYMWSQVIALDMFSRFEEEGIRNTDTAKSYRKKVLGPGGSRDAADLVEDFLGRPYGFEAFANRLNHGFEEPASAAAAAGN